MECWNIAYYLIDSSPGISALQIVGKLKQESTISVWKQFPQMLKRHFWKECTCWTDGYFVSTTGQASEKTIRKYIKSLFKISLKEGLQKLEPPCSDLC
ncbi:MAG: transposase [Chlamydiales bacterium]|nr:transposase [Chlamydiales bacterium]